MVWLLIGLFFAAVIKTYVPESFLLQYGTGIGAMLVMVLISIPMYICATASTPIAAGLMLAGVSPGAALVFMLAGPATNIATIMVIKNELGLRSMVGYLVGVIGTALISGLAFDAFLAWQGISIAVSLGDHSMAVSMVYVLSSFALAALMLRQFIKRIQAKRVPQAQSLSS